jgi:hypothetical protein
MMILPIENDLFKIRSDDGINYSYCHQFWRISEDVYTGKWSPWLPLKLYDNKSDALGAAEGNDEGWILLLQVSDRFCSFDLRDWQDKT